MDPATLLGGGGSGGLRDLQVPDRFFLPLDEAAPVESTQGDYYCYCDLILMATGRQKL